MPASPSFAPINPWSVDISSYVGAGGTFQIRFAEVDDLGEPFVFGVDDVSIDSVPEHRRSRCSVWLYWFNSARTLWTNCTAIDPSPTAAATRSCCRTARLPPRTRRAGSFRVDKDRAEVSSRPDIRAGFDELFLVERQTSP